MHYTVIKYGNAHVFLILFNPHFLLIQCSQYKLNRHFHQYSCQKILERKNSKNTSIILSFCVRHRIIVNNLEKKVISQKKS